MRDLAPHFEHKLFLTATPHNGYRECFSALLELRDNQRFSRGADPQREESDFLATPNHNGESFDFHSLRHTCGAWLAMSGAHPKVIQSVMRHSSITLTMDTYGHLFPDQEANAVAELRSLFAPAIDVAEATGTDGAAL